MEFLGIGKKFTNLRKVKAVVLKVPYEVTTSYVKGCSTGPSAILEASAEVELYDQEIEAKPHVVGIFTAEVPTFGENHDKNLKLIGKEYLKYYNMGKFTIALGGEHSISIGILESLAKKRKNFGVIQFDAHADLRSYFGTSYKSHACVMRRVCETVPNTYQLGIRSLSFGEAAFVKKSKLNVLWCRNLLKMSSGEVLLDIFSKMDQKDIYITFDVDYFGQDVIRSTGTPEPGGPDWFTTLEILRGLFEHYNVIGMDVVELIGSEDDPASAFSTALLIKKCLAYKFFT